MQNKKGPVRVPFRSNIKLLRGKIREKRKNSKRKVLKPLWLQDFSLVRGTGLEFKKNHFPQQITSNYVIFSSETIKHGISQPGCFIEDAPLKGQNKGQSQRT